MIRSILFSIFIFFISCLSGEAQHIEKGYFRSPLTESETLRLAGSFGELRTNHFHTGIDIKTCGTEGLPVYAAADGFVSRIAVSSGGYGNALYIDHPNGYTTVYGHLYHFANNIARFVRQTQYSRESFEQDFNPEPARFPVKKGDLIAFSGNTGSSEGAHLHFEIRETVSEKPVNPLLWGFAVPDTLLPVIRAIKVYALGPGSFIEAVYPKGKITRAVQAQNIKLEAGGRGGSYYLKNIVELRAGGQIGFAVETADFHEKDGHRIGVYSVELCADKVRRYFHSMYRLDFDMKRFVNAHVDYAERMRTGRWFQKSFIKGYNEAPIYEGLVDNGIITPAPDQAYQMQYYVKDAYGNQAILNFSVNGLSAGQAIAATDSSGRVVHYDAPFGYRENGLFVSFPPHTFYEDFTFRDKVSQKPLKGYSELHEFGSRYIGVHDYFDIGIRPENLPERLYSKAFLMSASYGFQGGIMQDGWLVARTRQLGSFYVAVDTTPPVIRPGNLKEGASLWKSAEIRFQISDNMAGIKSYRGTIDGHWVLFQYDAKKALLYYLFDENCPPGQHKLVLQVTDNRENTRTLTMNFSR